MDTLSEMNEQDVEELSKVREFNVERAQLVDFMRDLSTPYLKGKNVENKGANQTETRGEKSNRITIRPKGEKNVKGTSPPRVLIPPSSNTLRNNDTGSLLPNKKNRAPSNTADRFATPLYTSSNNSSNSTNRFCVETTVNRGKLLDFTEEQERERRRAEAALNRPRIGDPYQARRHCTIPSTSAHLEQLAQPKKVPFESSNERFSNYENEGSTFSEKQGISPSTTFPLRYPVELETSSQITGTKDVTKQANDAKSFSSLRLKEAPQNETSVVSFQRSASWNTHLGSPSRRRYLSCSTAPGVSKSSKMSPPPPRPLTRHAHSCSPHQRTSPVAIPLDSGERERNPAVNTSRSVHTNTASRLLGSSASFRHIFPPGLKSTSRFSGVSPIGGFQIPFASSSTRLQTNPRIPQQSWNSLSSKNEQQAHRKLFQENARKGTSVQSNPNEGRSLPNGNKKDSSSPNSLRKNSCSEITTLSFPSDSNCSNSSSLVMNSKVIKTPTCVPFEAQQPNPDSVFSLTSMKTIVLNVDAAEGSRSSAARSTASVSFHSLVGNPTPSDSQFSSEHSHSPKCASLVIPNQRIPREHSTSFLLKKNESESNELKNPFRKRVKEGDSTSLNHSTAAIQLRDRSIIGDSASMKEKEPFDSVAGFVENDLMKLNKEGDDPGRGRKLEMEGKINISLSSPGGSGGRRDSPSTSFRDPMRQDLGQNIHYRLFHDIGDNNGKDTRDTLQMTMEPSLVTDRQREESRFAETARLVKSQPAPSVTKRDDDGDDFSIPDPPMKVVTRRNKCEAAQWPPPEFASDEEFGSSVGFPSNTNTFSRAFSFPFTDVPAESGPAAVVVVKRSTSRKKSVKFTQKDNADDNN